MLYKENEWKALKWWEWLKLEDRHKYMDEFKMDLVPNYKEIAKAFEKYGEVLLTSHSPTPWRLEEAPKGWGRDSVLFDKDGKCIINFLFAGDQRLVDFKHTVKCVNEHDQLLEERNEFRAFIQYAIEKDWLCVTGEEAAEKLLLEYEDSGYDSKCVHQCPDCGSHCNCGESHCESVCCKEITNKDIMAKIEAVFEEMQVFKDNENVIVMSLSAMELCKDRLIRAYSPSLNMEAYLYDRKIRVYPTFCLPPYHFSVMKESEYQNYKSQGKI